MEACTWVYDDEDDYYETACGEAFTFIDGRLELHRFKWCPYCGKPIIQPSQKAAMEAAHEL